MASHVRTLICCAMCIVMVGAIWVTSAIDARAQVDPIALQQQAIEPGRLA